VPDDTLGAEQSQVIQNANGTPNEVIVGGAQREQNLFHSFEEFNVDEGRGAFFFSPDDVTNIFCRVTGNNPSNILGTLGTIGSNADLFFMNPNGILFGPNSSLNVQGSFAAITADAIQFGDQGFFSATNPEAPSDLLTINPSAFFFNQPGSIINRSVSFGVGSQVPDGENLLLLGGDVLIDGGILSALGGRIDIGAVGGNGVVSLNADRSLSFPETLRRADITFNGSVLTSIGFDNRGGITVTGQNILLTNNTFLGGGITQESDNVSNQAGDIILNAIDNIRITEESSVANTVLENASGTGGNIDISTATLEVFDRSRIATNTSGLGNSGGITINASDRVTFDNLAINSSINPDEVLLIISTVEEGAVGNAGDISITTQVLEAANGVQLLVSTRGKGNAGSININASDHATLERTGFFSGVEIEGTGNAGNININAGILEGRGGVAISANTQGRGNAGSIFINVTDQITFDSTTINAAFPNGIFSIVELEATGNGGNIEITTDNLNLIDGAIISTSTLGQGNSGNLTITTGSLNLLNNSQLNVGTFGQGDAGSIIINANDYVTLNNSLVSSSVDESAVGNGNNITINTPTLDLLGESILSSGTLGLGDAGSIFISVDERIRLINSGVLSAVGEEAIGNGGDVKISTTILELRDGASIAGSTLNEGNSGNIIINARDYATLDNSSIQSVVGANAIGRAGDMSLSTTTLHLLDRSRLATNTLGEGNAGNINVTTAILNVSDESQLVANTQGEGNAGNIRIRASDRVTFEGTSEVNSIVLEGATGNGGNIDISTSTLDVLNGAALLTSTLGKGDAGSIVINASDRITFRRQSSAFSNVEAGATGNGSNINITASILEVLNNSFLSTSTSGEGNAGSIILEISDYVTFDGRSSALSGVLETEAIGDGGDIDITTDTLNVLGNAVLLTSTRGIGNAGNVIINASDHVIITSVPTT